MYPDEAMQEWLNIKNNNRKHYQDVVIPERLKELELRAQYANQNTALQNKGRLEEAIQMGKSALERQGLANTGRLDEIGLSNRGAGAIEAQKERFLARQDELNNQFKKPLIAAQARHFNTMGDLSAEEAIRQRNANADNVNVSEVLTPEQRKRMQLGQIDRLNGTTFLSDYDAGKAKEEVVRSQTINSPAPEIAKPYNPYGLIIPTDKPNGILEGLAVLGNIWPSPNIFDAIKAVSGYGNKNATKATQEATSTLNPATSTSTYFNNAVSSVPISRGMSYGSTVATPKQGTTLTPEHVLRNQQNQDYQDVMDNYTTDKLFH